MPSDDESEIRIERLPIVDETVPFSEDEFQRVVDIIDGEKRAALERDVEIMLGITNPSPFFIGARIVAYDGLLIHCPSIDLLELGKPATETQPETGD